MKGLLSLNKPIILLCFLAMACTPLPLPQDIPSSPKPEATTIVQPQAIPEPTPTPTFDPFQPPVIEKITPTSAKPGDMIAIDGTDFSPNADDNIVEFYGQRLTITEASVNQLKIIIPVPKRYREGEISIARNLVGHTINNATLKIILEYPIVTTYIDNLNPGNRSAASISGIAIDKDKNIYASDSLRHCLYKITPDEQITVFAGRCAFLETDYPSYRDGLGADARFNLPGSIVIGPDENLYVADPGNHRIRKITPDAMVTTFAGNDYTVEKAVDQAFDREGNLYVIEQSYLSDQRYSVKRITKEGNVTTIRLQPTIKDISFCTLAIDQQGDLYVGGCNEFKIWKIHVNGIYGDVSSFISHEKYGRISDMVFDQQGNLLVLAYNNYSILKIFPNGDITTVAGSGEKGNTDGAALQAQFKQLGQIAIDQKGDLLVSDDIFGYELKIRKVFLVD